MIHPAPSWFVMFSGAEKRTHLIDYFSPLAFLHVNAFFYDPNAERWIIYDVNRGGIAIVAMTSAQFDVYVAEMKRTAFPRVLRVDWQPAIRWPIQLGMWCVVAVRYATGAKSLAWRPIGLYRDLRKAGAEEVEF